MHPPCMAVDTITTGKQAAMRSSMAPRIIDCVPPPDSPVTPMRVRSTSGSVSMKSIARIEFQVCRPNIVWPCCSACGEKKR